jgi:hypothetical protein
MLIKVQGLETQYKQIGNGYKALVLLYKIKKATTSLTALIECGCMKSLLVPLVF